MYVKRVIIEDKERIKLWPADILSMKASNFQSNIKIKEIEKEVNCNSYKEIFDIILNKKCILAVVAEGIDDERAIDEIVDLIENQFGEEQYKYQFFLD
jgi:phosphotransferase system HPr (HPr) family protein